MKERYILSLDQGTTSSRAILFNKSGVVIGQRQIPFTQIFPRPGWVEHDPEEIWGSQLAAARGAIEASQIESDQVSAIGIANQRETTVVWERATGKPVYNAIVWQCRRSSDICGELRALGLSDLIRDRTGLVIDPYFSGTKLMWLFDQLPGLRGRAERGELLFGTIDTWLIYKLTGAHLTDPTNASRTMLFNIRTGAWDEEILKVLKIPRPSFRGSCPAPASSALARKEFLGTEIPVAGCAGDRQRPFSATSASSPARRRTPTAPVALR